MIAKTFTMITSLRRTTRQALVLCASLVGLLAPAAASASEDTTIMPGSACKLAGFQGADVGTQSFAGRFQNASASVIPATCPIARAVADSDSLEYASVLVSGQVSCSLVLISSTGDFQRVPSSGSQAVGDKILLQWALGDANVYVPNPGAYAFDCTLESSGVIYYYQIDENDGED